MSRSLVDTLAADLFDGEERETALAPGAVLLPGFALAVETPLLTAVRQVAEAAPFRHMLTPGGHRMSAAMTSCGDVGWVTDRSGYRYTAVDPATGRPWPPVPAVLADLAARAAAEAGYPAFTPDACLINRYEPGARMSLHQDRDERDFSAPIVSVSLGLPVIFLFGGAERSDPAKRIPLVHGDVVVWGGPSRLHFHGVLPLKEGAHPLLGRLRVNLTFRKAL
jgi:alkylated DNA repair protein (DNA oxidative demethylase)